MSGFQDQIWSFHFNTNMSVYGQNVYFYCDFSPHANILKFNLQSGFHRRIYSQKQPYIYDILTPSNDEGQILLGHLGQNLNGVLKITRLCFE